MREEHAVPVVDGVVPNVAAKHRTEIMIRKRASRVTSDRQVSRSNAYLLYILVHRATGGVDAPQFSDSAALNSIKSTPQYLSNTSGHTAACRRLYSSSLPGLSLMMEPNRLGSYKQCMFIDDNQPAYANTPGAIYPSFATLRKQLGSCDNHTHQRSPRQEPPAEQSGRGQRAACVMRFTRCCKRVRSFKNVAPLKHSQAEVGCSFTCTYGTGVATPRKDLPFSESAIAGAK